jgi:hypothetical protein
MRYQNLLPHYGSVLPVLLRSKILFFFFPKAIGDWVHSIQFIIASELANGNGSDKNFEFKFWKI